jgi:hypothetical protein
MSDEDALKDWNDRGPSSEAMQAVEQHYIGVWRRILWDALGDQTKVDRVVLLADLNGLFDPARAALFACGRLAEAQEPR